MSHLRLRHDDGVGSDDADEQRDTLPFPIGWRDSESLAADLLDAAATTDELERTIEQMASETPGFRERMKSFIDGLVSHLWLDQGRLVYDSAAVPDDVREDA